MWAIPAPGTQPITLLGTIENGRLTFQWRDVCPDRNMLGAEGPAFREAFVKERTDFQLVLGTFNNHSIRLRRGAPKIMCLCIPLGGIEVEGSREGVGFRDGVTPSLECPVPLVRNH